MKKSQDISKIEQIRHSLAHILAMAVLKKFPDAKLGIGPTIDNGFYYDFELSRPLANNDLPLLEKSIRDFIAQDLNFAGEKITPAKARKLFREQPFKLELIKDFAKEKKELTAYYTCSHNTGAKVTHLNCFFDLCLGGHVANTKEINPDGFRLTKLAGAYWRGNEKNLQLTRIYGAAFQTKKELDEHLNLLAEAEKRDHRVLGERLGIFMFSEKVGPGFPIWLPNGAFIKHALEEYMRKIEEEAGYRYVSTGVLALGDLYEASGHKKYFTQDMYRLTDVEDKEMFIKPMNCPHHHMIFKKLVRSYRDLPLRLAEAGAIYRNERSGTLYGLIRVRGPITQNDAHIYSTEENLEDEFVAVLGLFKRVYERVGIKNYWFRLSLPDFQGKNKAKFGGDTAAWQEAAKVIERASKKAGVEIVPVLGEAAFYGPKIDVQIKNVFGKEDTIATSQIDILVPKRMGLTYVDREGKEKYPFVIHRAILGAYERFIAFLLEQTAGNLPFWLSPIQIKLLTINDTVGLYAKSIVTKLRKNFRVEIDERNESIGKKIREAEMQKIPFLVVIGNHEVETSTISVRGRGKGDLGKMNLNEFIGLINKDQG